MKTLTVNSGWNFHLFTFEQPEYQLSAEEIKEYERILKNHNIYWYPKTHHTGNWILLKKAYDLMSLFGDLLRLRIKGVKVIWSFANVAASISFIYSKILNLRTIIFSYEPHSDFLVELGLWNKYSFKYKILNFLEWRAGIQADYILTGTKFMVSELKHRGTRAKVFRAPTGVDENDFYYREGARSVLYSRHGIKSYEKVILYIGKLGELYYSWQIPLLFKLLNSNIDGLRFILISSTPTNKLVEYFHLAGFDLSKIIYLRNIPGPDIKLYISGSDLGISAVPPSDSQKFRSPTKVAEYLLCGLPYITCKGVSEDDLMVQTNNVGAVLDNFEEHSIVSSIPQIKAILNVDRKLMIDRCRKAGLEYRAKSSVDQTLMRIFENILSQK